MHLFALVAKHKYTQNLSFIDYITRIMQITNRGNMLSPLECDRQQIKKGFGIDDDNNKNSNSSSYDQSNNCPLCDGLAKVFDAESGEVICGNCGVVICDSIELGSSDWRFYTSNKSIDQTSPNTRTPTSLAFYDRGLSTYISNSRKDAHGSPIKQEQKIKIQKMRKWNSISNNNKSSHRNLRSAFSILDILGDKLSLTPPIIEKSAYYYRKVVDKNIIKGRSITGFVVASVYVACKELNVPRPLAEIAIAVNADPVFAGKCYRMLLTHLKLCPPNIDSMMYVSRIAQKARVSEWSYRRGLKILKEVKENPVSYGKDPNALAAAVLYVACIKEGEKASQSHIATAGNISVVTLRKRALDIMGVLDSGP